jgi:cytochrome c-type biogenesis protein CcmH/NrfG
VGQYEEVARRSRQGQAGYHRRGHIEALYYIGRNAFRQRRQAAAVRSFGVADSLGYTLGDKVADQAANGYSALVNLYLGMTYDELGRREAAVRCFERVLELPEWGTSHEQAKRYRKKPFARQGGEVGSPE